jgi:hypothetical protein
MNQIIVKTVGEKEREQSSIELKTYGYSKICGYIGGAHLEKLRSIVESQYQKNLINGINKYPGAPDRDINDKIIYNICNYDNIFIDILTTDFIRSLAMENLNDAYYRYLPEDVPNYILTYYNARSSGSALDLHIDSHIPFISDKPIMMQFVILLEDSTEQNGCTIVVPGSHQSGNFTNRNLQKITPLTGSAGDLIFWDSRLWHGTLANTSSASRWALIATMGMWWIKQSMDLVRSLPNSIYQNCSLEQKQLLGFCSIPPVDPFERTNTKTGYDFLQESKYDYKF